MNPTSVFGPLLVQLEGLPPLVAVLAKITMLLAIVWTCHALLWRANPRWRVVMWRGAVIGLLLIPFLHFIAPPVEYRSLGENAVSDRTVRVGDESKARSLKGSRFSSQAVPPSDDVFMMQEPSFSPIGIGQRLNWEAILLAIWFSGVAFCFARMAVGLSCIRSLVSESAPAAATIKAAFACVAGRLAVNMKVQVRVSRRVSTPILCGLFRKTLLIPRRMSEESREQHLPGVFAHELSHVQSHDLDWNLLLHSLSALLWFHPLSWFTRAAHAAACEAVSDAVAADYLGDVRAYGRTLAQVALDAVDPPALSLAMAPTSEIQRRVRALEKHVYTRRLRWHWAAAAVAIMLLVAGLLGGMKIVRAEVGAVSSEDDVAADSGDVATTNNNRQTSLVTPEAEAAVNKAWSFLAARQRDDGSFGGEERSFHDPAMTALCGLAFLAGGHKPGAGTYGEELQKALDYLLDHVQEDGFIGVRKNVGSMYAHAYALRFLAEAQLVRRMPQTEKAIARAVELIVSSQNARDGWRYAPNSQDADSSVTSCQVIALQAARRAGAKVPDETLERAIKYLKRCQTPDGGYAYITEQQQSALPRSAAVMSALFLSAIEHDQIRRGTEYLKANATPPNKQSPYFYYAQFHLSTAMRHAGDGPFRDWYEPSRDQLLEMQAGDGSWSLQHWVPEYATSQACVILLSPRKSIVELPDDRESDRQDND